MAVNTEVLKRKVVVTGGTGATGLPIVIEFAKRNLVSLVLIREVKKVIENPDTGKKVRISSDKRIRDFQDKVESQTGIRPLVARGDLSEIDTPEKAEFIVNGFNLAPREPVHYAPIAAEGINAYILSLAKDLRDVRNGFANGVLTEVMLKDATERMWQNYTTPEKMRLAMQSNCIAHTLILDELIARGHIDQLSVVGMIASTFSADVNPRTLKYIYPGPGFYWPVAYSKMMQVEEVRKRAPDYGFKAIDVVAPEIADTDVGGFLEEFANWINAAFPGSPAITIPKTRTGVVAKVFVEQFIETGQRGERFTRQFIDSSGEVSDFRPANWPKQILRGYL